LINGQAFKGLTAGLTLAELSALYFSRTLVASLAGTPFRDDVESAFGKLASALTPHMRQFLDQLPRAIATKPDPMRRLSTGDERQERALTRALEATLHQRQATIVYHSKASDRTKTYHIHPYRLAYAQGGLYLLAYVPEYSEMRTFALERVEEMSLLEEHYTPIEDLPEEAFPNSLGVHSGPPEHVEIEFQPGVADYVRARAWHHSQQIDQRADGSLVLSLDVCLDRSLTSWILSFGPFARVVAPPSLRADIGRDLAEAAARYSGAEDRQA
jgi:predicted DNA-binding transcriptional regulator YafY